MSACPSCKSSRWVTADNGYCAKCLWCNWKCCGEVVKLKGAQRELPGAGDTLTCYALHTAEKHPEVYTLQQDGSPAGQPA